MVAYTKGLVQQGGCMGFLSKWASGDHIAHRRKTFVDRRLGDFVSDAADLVRARQSAARAPLEDRKQALRRMASGVLRRLLRQEIGERDDLDHLAFGEPVRDTGIVLDFSLWWRNVYPYGPKIIAFANRVTFDVTCVRRTSGYDLLCLDQLQIPSWIGGSDITSVYVARAHDGELIGHGPHPRMGSPRWVWDAPTPLLRCRGV